ncbi:hypothetical protein DSO57_1013697 [Entomophthora muscae]|uniref:Uncharacterized protein n=1 Tax=Entomophthora muscae TaxID=34485 RepID=A0ACC2THD4_9FUNG|nr:hypothetical protein DSO57_1013697 [Entomophthora muscae]
MAILAPFKNAFDAILSCALPSHSCHNLTFNTTVDLVKIDAPMYPLSKLEDKVLGAWLDNMLAKGWIVKKASLISSLMVFAKKSDGSHWLCVDYTLLTMSLSQTATPSPWKP